MSCLDEERVLSFVEGGATPDERRDVETHLAECGDCRAWVARAAEALLSTGLVDDDDTDAPLRRPQSGEHLGRYRVTEFLGAGAMGVVVAAEDTELGRDVALKLLRKDSSPGARQRFFREAKLASSISHPAIVTVFDVLTTQEGHPVLVMDRLRGETLRDHLHREKRLTPEQTAQLLAPVLDALSAAHARGIVHRDLKPENIFLQSGDLARPRLLDFGVAKLVGATDGSGELTRTGAIVGTPHYMAPEQAFAERDVDQRADLWAVGVIAYECLSGARPIEADSVGQVFKGLALGAFVPLSERRPELPKRVTAWVEGLLVEKSARETDADRLREALAGWSSASDTTTPSQRAWLPWALVAAAALGGAIWFASRAPASASIASEVGLERKPGHQLAPAASFVLSASTSAAAVGSAAAPLAGAPLGADAGAPLGGDAGAAMASSDPSRRPVALTRPAGAPAAPKPSASSPAPVASDPSSVGPGKLLTKPPF
ncbi:MAG: protein kinase [Polyangiaceae bacterium]